MNPITLIGSAFTFAAESSTLAALSTSPHLDALANRISGGTVNRVTLSATVNQKVGSWVKEALLQSNLLGVGTPRLLHILERSVAMQRMQLARALISHQNFPTALANRSATGVHYLAGNNIVGNAAAWSACKMVWLALALLQRLASTRNSPALSLLTAKLITHAIAAPESMPPRADLLAVTQLISVNPLHALGVTRMLPNAVPSLIRKFAYRVADDRAREASLIRSRSDPTPIALHHRSRSRPIIVVTVAPPNDTPTGTQSVR